MNTSYETIDYEYHNMPIPGGGYVTGFLFHPLQKDVLYARTDIGGTYRYSFEEKRWKSLIDHVTMFDLSESYPTAIALDCNHPEYLYIACGCSDWDSGVLAFSMDYGETFSYSKIPCKVHGNFPGRGTGSRLMVDPANSNVLYFASQTAGLLKSDDQGNTWSVISLEDMDLDRENENNLTFVWVNPNKGNLNNENLNKTNCNHTNEIITNKIKLNNNKKYKYSTIVVGTAGIDNALDEGMRGHSLYISYDSGYSFAPLPMPESKRHSMTKLSGYVGQRYDYDGKYLYITLSCTGKNSYLLKEGYSCDSGDAYDGRVLRYSFLDDGTIEGYKDITPDNKALGMGKSDTYDFGFSGISSCPSRQGLLMCTTICREQGDVVFLSKDYGESWEVSLYNLSIGNLTFQTPYMKPEYNGGHSLLHWLSDIKINPFDSNQVLFNSGTGIFMTENLLEEDCFWSDCCKGLEETVHLNVYSPPAGDVKVIDIVGDLGGFAFTELDKPCENSFADERGNRYITCMNADYSDYNPNYLVVTPRGNWTGKTKGGLIVSQDQGKTFKRLSMPFGISDFLDELLHRIECPNVNSGWVALAADGSSIVWSVANNLDLPVEAIIYSKDEGDTFHLVKVFDIQGKQVQNTCIKVFSDRVNGGLFYGFGTDSRIFISKDGGECFYEYEIPDILPRKELCLIDSMNKVEIRGESGREGVFWMAFNTGGLWKMQYHVKQDRISFQKISNGDDVVFRVGLGIGSNLPDSDYVGDEKTIYIAAILSGTYGFWRSTNQGISWQRINDKNQMFGDILSIDGDSRIFGQFYLATGSRGLIYGKPVK